MSGVPQRQSGGQRESRLSQAVNPKLPNAIRRLLSLGGVQALLVLLTGVGIPVALRLGVPDAQTLASAFFQNSVYAAAFAAMAGVLISRRVSAFPGTKWFSLIIPSYATAFGVVAIILLGLRWSYSSSLLFLSFLASTFTAFGLVYITRAGALLTFHLVPSDDLMVMDELPDVNWLVMQAPILPTTSDAIIVADLRADLGFDWENMLARAALAGIPVFHVKQVRESLTGRVHIEHLSENSLGTLSPNALYQAFKRTFDLLSCLVLLPILLVPMLIVGVAVRLTSPGPSLFRQERVGYGGKIFRVIKFRTMREEGDHAAHGPTGASMMHDETRITPIGRLLRRTRIDELPQLCNVLLGQMSLIGPRPEALPLSEWYNNELPFYSYRHIVRPGITGWAQVNQGHVAELADVNVKLHYDFYYINNFSLWLDFLIVLRTFSTVITGFGAR